MDVMSQVELHEIHRVDGKMMVSKGDCTSCRGGAQEAVVDDQAAIVK